MTGSISPIESTPDHHYRRMLLELAERLDELQEREKKRLVAAGYAPSAEDAFRLKVSLLGDLIAVLAIAEDSKLEPVIEWMRARHAARIRPWSGGG